MAGPGGGAHYPKDLRVVRDGEYSLAEVTRMAKAAGMVFRKSGNPVPKATIHKIIQNRIYTDEFDFDGKTYRGRYKPIISRELWERVQQRSDRPRQFRKHDFAFADCHFGPFREHAPVKLARELRQTDGVAYDAMMSLAIHTTDTETLRERVPLERAAADRPRRGRDRSLIRVRPPLFGADHDFLNS